MSTNFDRRRINGPEESSPPTFDEKEDAQLDRWRFGEPRPGRSSGDIRPIFLQPGLISQANGSAYIETERTKIACAVFVLHFVLSYCGLHISTVREDTDLDNPKLQHIVKTVGLMLTSNTLPSPAKGGDLPCAFMHGAQDAEDRSIAVAIHQAIVPSVRLELLPKSTIDIFITIVENDGIEGCMAAGSIAASIALADAGIDMIGLVVSCSGSIVGQEIWLDPTQKEMQVSKGCLILSCMPALGTITNVWESGQMKPQELLKCMDLCQERCTDVHSVVAQALLDRAKAS